MRIVAADAVGTGIHGMLRCRLQGIWKMALTAHGHVIFPHQHVLALRFVGVVASNAPTACYRTVLPQSFCSDSRSGHFRVAANT